MVQPLFLFQILTETQEALLDTPDQLTRTEREALFTRCASVVFGPYTTYPSGWVINSKQDNVRLRRENVIEWLLWALFACKRENALLDEWKDEMEGYIRSIEERLGYKLEEGHDENARSMRLTFDELESSYRLSVHGCCFLFAEIPFSDYAHHSLPRPPTRYT
ncbi:hypothetical protein E1B28_003077 [Marasmius oreades]|uniref:Uncharacterized protein n=1 Tax=Marasmius oreades TaxID=181124 RepID=A0A9P7UJ57_9AGAR|nr:uncharacterized protein E1B28_003077 [Marasmius oreades]KAG7085517.1 hypothetical protein E1B28_003077 [Marasmius oreades]